MISQPHAFFLVGYFGVPPICRSRYLPDSSAISANRCVLNALERSKGSFVLARCLQFPMSK
jgi:hypothetical protein